MSNTVMNLLCMAFGMPLYIFLLGIYLEVELLCHRGVY